MGWDQFNTRSCCMSPGSSLTEGRVNRMTLRSVSNPMDFALLSVWFAYKWFDCQISDCATLQITRKEALLLTHILQVQNNHSSGLHCSQKLFFNYGCVPVCSQALTCSLTSIFISAFTHRSFPVTAFARRQFLLNALQLVVQTSKGTVNMVVYNQPNNIYCKAKPPFTKYGLDRPIPKVVKVKKTVLSKYSLIWLTDWPNSI